MADIGKDIAKARELLSRGLLVAIPTETVYGLAANALDENAVLHIFEVKNRPKFDPLIVHGPDKDRLSLYVKQFPDWALALAQHFWPGPLTLVLQKRDSVPDIVTSGFATVAVRVPQNPLTYELLLQLEFPLAAPSANPFGFVSPTTAQHVQDQLGNQISYILDGGECSVGLESTIVAEQDGTIHILRLGGTSVEEIESVIGPVTIGESNAVMPGSLGHHYATRTPLKLGPIDLTKTNPDLTGILSFQKRCPEVPPEHQIVLSPDGNLREASRYLFAAMRHLDSLKLKEILVEPFPEIGLGRAINDRLRRAAE
ncbi:MAG TPA: L-threonylcarbamoyladenylate synthase [Candidatus Kapabacteria bacterium]|jgi:L-threonylcarbamoyladenylate synthase